MRKLTESDKKEILKLYRETAETTSTLAERYDVSNSTISRLLKSTLAEDEYEYLVSLKRAARTPEGRAQVNYDKLPVFKSQEEEDEEEPPVKVKAASSETSDSKETKRVKKVQPYEPVIERKPSQDDSDAAASVNRRVRRRSSAPDDFAEPRARQLELLEQTPPEIADIPNPLDEEVATVGEANAIAQMLGEDLLDEADDLDDLLEDDDDDDYDDDTYEATPLVKRPRSGQTSVPVLPLSQAALPKTCYLVIDRSAELITRPLKDFGDLGQIPSIETQQRTLPIFDNHRVAKRFSTKRDRVIKVPDSRMLHKASTHLQAKGITRLLIDGQVYSLPTA